jgi:hypothetical protein
MICIGIISSVLLEVLHVRMNVMDTNWIVLCTDVHLSIEISTNLLLFPWPLA